MRTGRLVSFVASVAALCTSAALALPSGSADASVRAAAGRQQTYLIFLRTPSAAATTGRDRALIASSQASVSTRLAALGVTPLHQYLVPDVITARLDAAQAASLRFLPGVAAVLANGLIPAPRLTTSSLQFHRSTAHAVKTHTTPVPCGTAAKPEIDPEALGNIDALPAISSGADGQGVKVAFVADGVDPTNPDFQRNAKYASAGSPTGSPVITNYVDFGGDGTAAPTAGGEAFLDASSMVAQGNTVYDLSNYVNPAHPLPAGCDITITGDAPGASLTAIKVFANAFTTNADFVAAINYAVTHGVQVLNESFGSNPFPDDSLDATKLADDAAVKAGVTVVASTGDAGITSTLGTPADDPLVIAAGATTTFRSYQQYTDGGINAPGIGNGSVIDNNISALSSAGFAFNGKTVDLVAPGDLNWALCSTSSDYADCGGVNLELSGGTSESAPLISGAAADVIQAYAASHSGKTPSPALVKHILTSTAKDIYAPGQEQGAGILDVDAAVKLARSIKGTTVKHSGGLLASTSQLDLSGLPGTHSKGSVSLTNTGSKRVTIHPYVRQLVKTGGTAGAVTLDPSTSTVQPKFPIWSGYEETYQTAKFTVPAGVGRLTFAAAYQDTNQTSLLHVALFNPSGTYAGYSLPQGLGDYANIGVAKPAAGTWTAVFFTEWDGDGAGAQGTAGLVPWTASYWKYQHTGTVSSSFSIGAGSTKTLSVSLQNPSGPGDTGYSLVLGGTMTLPITLRTTVAVSAGGKYAGVLTGGNGRGGAPAQTSIYSFKVPSGKNDLDASLKMSSNAPDAALPGAEVVGELVDPTGQVQAYDTNYTENSGGFTVTPYLNLYKASPSAGTWELVLDWLNPVMGDVTAIPFTGAVTFNLVDTTSNLPDSSTTTIGSGGASYSVDVHNNGVAPLLITLDARLPHYVTYPLSDVFGNPMTQAIPGVAYNGFFVPNETQSFSVSQVSTVPASFDLSTFPGDPDLSPLNGSQLGVNATQTSSAASLQFAPATGVTPGLWFDEESVDGPFGSGAATSGSETTTASVLAKEFDPAVSSPAGDFVEYSTTGATAPNAAEFDPGTSGAIPVQITPTGTVGSVSTGTLYVVGLSGPGIFVPSLGPEELFPNEIAALPYQYTVGS